MENILYREVTLFSNSVIWLVVISITFCSVYFALPQLFAIVGDKPPSTIIIIASSVFLVIGLILPIVLLAIKLRIQVRNDGLYVKIIPFQISFKKISLSDIQNCEPYMAQEKEENKLGLKYAISRKAYSFGGRRGIRIEFKDGHIILLESKHPEKIIQAIKMAHSTGR